MCGHIFRNNQSIYLILTHLFVYGSDRNTEVFHKNQDLFVLKRDWVVSHCFGLRVGCMMLKRFLKYVLETACESFDISLPKLKVVTCLMNFKYI